MTQIVDSKIESEDRDVGANRRAVPRWIITLSSVAILTLLWEWFGRDINPVFGSYPSAIAEAFWDLARSGKLAAAMFESLRPFVVGYCLAILLGVPLGLVIGRYRVAEAALGIYVTAGYAMPLVALVPLLVLWLGLGFAVKAAVVFLMSVFPICINTWLGGTPVPQKPPQNGEALPPPKTPPPPPKDLPPSSEAFAPTGGRCPGLLSA